MECLADALSVHNANAGAYRYGVRPRNNVHVPVRTGWGFVWRDLVSGIEVGRSA
jgi:hypothetical protein